MALPAVWALLNTELSTLSDHFRNFAGGKPQIASASDFSFMDECLLEGMLSRVWQTWCRFCRGCVIESCVGTTNYAGAVVAALPSATTEAHVSSAAITAANHRSKPPYWGNTNTTLRFEPTWGDVDTLAKILPRLNPNNVTQLLAAFSSGHGSAKALQIIRNCAAHNNVQSLADVNSLRSLYKVYPVTHPTHALYWIEPRSGDFLVTKAIEELIDVGLTAIS